MWYGIFAVFLTLHSCKTSTIDTTLDPVSANYPSAELYVGEQVFHGVAYTSLVAGSRLPKKTLSFKGYFDGSAKITSDNCKLDKTIEYRNHELVHIEVTEPILESCVVSVLIQPKIDDLERRGRRSPSFKGTFLIRALAPNDQWLGKSSKIREGLNETLAIMLPEGETEVDIYAAEKDLEFNVLARVKDGVVKINAKDILYDIKKETYFVEGVIRHSKGLIFFSWIIHGFDKNFAQISEPSIIISSEDKDTFSADPTTLFSSIDDTYKKGHEQKFKFNVNDPHIYRAFTANGRNVICDWDIAEKEWVCQN